MMKLMLAVKMLSLIDYIRESLIQMEQKVKIQNSVSRVWHNYIINIFLY